MSARYDSDFRAIFHSEDRGDLDFFRALVLATDGDLCEVGAGTGRVLLAVAPLAGTRRVFGVEPSESMRDRLVAKLASPGSPRVEVLDGSFTKLPLPEASLGLVFGAFRSFQHVLTVEAQLAALDELHRVLEPGGLLALDFFDPAYHLLKRSRPTLGACYGTPDGTTVERWESREVDRVAQRVDVTFRWIERRPDRSVVHDEAATYAVRYTFPNELIHLLARSGFEAIDLRGGYDGRPLGKTPRELVVTARKRAGSKAVR
jgi:ubiquinone/menaquinone biosynthesis C-methylase UbiE